ncbi:MAG: translation initiation factor IF-5A [Hadesarchaea archaeon]|nr:translation initiation factor IF-5A [Hadesarchaea archaeon]
MAREMTEVGKLNEGNFIIVNEEPCRVAKITTSSPGKHGHAKSKIYAVGIFDGQKRTLVKPSDAKLEAPIIERSTAQVLAVISNSAQLMDLSSYETFELQIPLELRGELEEGDELEYIQALGRKKIERKKG